MSFFPRESDRVGVDFQGPSMRVATLRKQKRAWHVLHLKEVATTSALLEGVSRDAVTATALCPRQTLVRPFHIQLKREKDIHAALDFQTESLLPFPPQQALVEAQILSQNDKGSALTLSATKKESLKKHLESITPFEPECVTCVYSALAAFSSLLPQSSQRLLVIHIGERDVACALVEGGRLVRGHSFERSKDFETEIKKMALAFSNKTFESIFLLGNDNPAFAEEIKKATGETAHYPSIPFLHLPQERLIKFGLAIGIALVSQKVNFRKQEFVYPYPLRRFKRSFVIFSALCLMLTSAFFVFSKFSLSHQEHLVSMSYQTLLTAAGKEDANMPKTTAEYNIELEKIENEVMNRPDTFPLLPAVPKVRETLFFLTNQAPGITIQNFHYQMTGRPQPQQKKEHYCVRVLLEFTAEDAAAAHAFHEKLLAPNAIVDPKMEVTWESSKGLYRTSFVLKDKTRYHG